MFLDWNSALFMILAGSKEEHLDMLDGGIIQKLLEEKWKTFAQRQFLKRITIAFLHLLTMSFAVYLRPIDRKKSLMVYNEAIDLFRLGFELCTIASCISYVIFQQGEEIKNQGFLSFLKQLPQSPPKALFLVANFTILASIPFRIIGDVEAEEVLLSFSMVGSWFFMMFFAGAVRLTGPFITMIFSMITGDMLTFGIIYVIFLLAFSQAFFYLYKTHPTVNDLLFENYPKTWMALYQMTLGSYSYNDLSLTAYPNVAKGVFITFMIMVPILLLNMLIAMMGNTYSQVIERSEKEFVKQWAKLVVSLERAVSQDLARQYIQEYSIKLGGSLEVTELRGVMVIKTKNKTRANQRKGAVSNWKRVGKVTIHALKKRGMTGEEMRLLMWGHRASVCTPQANTPRQSMEVVADPLLGMTHEIGNGGLNLVRSNGALISKLNAAEGVIPQNEGTTPFAPLPNNNGDGTFNQPANHGLLQLPINENFQFPVDPESLDLETPTGEEIQNNLCIESESIIDDYEVVDQPIKVKRRHITSGLRPRILIMSDKTNLFRINLDSDESENEILFDPRAQQYHYTDSSLRMSNPIESTNLISPRDINSPEQTEHNTEEVEIQHGVDNPAFVSDENVDMVASTSTPTTTSNTHHEEPPQVVETKVKVKTTDPPEILITDEKNIKSTRPKSAKHSASASSTPELKIVDEVNSPEPIGSDGNSSNQIELPVIESDEHETSKGKHKKRKVRSSSAKHGTTVGDTKISRPQTAFEQNPANRISNMNQLVAWDRPEDDI